MDIQTFQEIVRKELGPRRLLEEKGRVLYSSVYSIREWQNGIYVLGLDPGGEPEGHKTIADDIDQREMTIKRYCALRDERWRQNEPGSTPYQRHSLRALELLGYDAMTDEVPVSNAIFSAQSDANNLRRYHRFQEFKWACWGVHKRFLQTIKPKTILCLGASEGLSSFSLVKEWSGETYRQIDIEHPHEKQTASQGKFGSVQFYFLDSRMYLVGIKHPSYFRGGFPEKLGSRLQKARQLGMGKPED